MKFIPAIDLKDNQCVRLEKGKEKNITIFNKDPIQQAKFFQQSGCERIHIVDLDAAFGRPDINKQTILEIRKNINISIELGGGIKNETDTSFWFNEGVDYLIIGSLAVKDKELVIEMTNKYKNRIYISLDVLNENIMIKGWVENSQLKIDDVLNFYNKTNIRGFVFTDIARDGMLKGLDINLINSFATKTNKNLIVGGGLSSYDDIYNLQNVNHTNLEGIIAGKAFYAGNIEVEKALKMLNQNA